MRVATCVVDITPQHEVHLCGYVGEARKHPAKGIHDNPLAVSLLLEVQNVRLLFLSVDVIAVDGKKSSIIKKEICEEIGMDEQHIIISAIHSHSLPKGFMREDSAFDQPNDPEYFTYVCSRIVESIKGIDMKLTDVTASIAECKIHGYYSKRSDIEAEFDDNAAIIKFMNGEKVVAAMCNFNCHATVLGPDNMLLSTDLIGKVRSILEKELGVIPYTFTGASGDISNRQFRQGNDFDELDRVGTGIADILKKMDSYNSLDLGELHIKKYEHHIVYDNTLHYDDYRREIKEAEKELAQKNVSLDVWKLRSSEIMALNNKLNVKTVDFYVRGIVIHSGNLTIVTFPGELASKFGLQLRKICKTEHFLLIGYANDFQGYFIETEDYGKTYETKASNTPRGESEAIVDEIGELL